MFLLEVMVVMSRVVDEVRFTYVGRLDIWKVYGV